MEVGIIQRFWRKLFFFCLLDWERFKRFIHSAVIYLLLYIFAIHVLWLRVALLCSSSRSAATERKCKNDNCSHYQQSFAPASHSVHSDMVYFSLYRGFLYACKMKEGDLR